MIFSRRAYPGESSHNLDMICKRLGLLVNPEDRHRSIGDIKLTAKAFVLLKEKLGEQAPSREKWTFVEFYPKNVSLVPTPKGTDFCKEENVPKYSSVHLNLDVGLHGDEVKQIAEKFAYPYHFDPPTAVRCMRASARTTGGHPIRSAESGCHRRHAYGGGKVSLLSVTRPSSSRDYHRYFSFNCFDAGSSPRTPGTGNSERLPAFGPKQ
ncbi:unnamed protein product [Sphagnum balticum]